MSNHNQQKLGDAIKEMLKLYRLDEKIDEHLLVRSWEKAVGPMIARHTTDIFVSNKKLVVTIDSAPLRQELLYARSKILKDLNAMVGSNVAEELVLR
jgi:predicted nucleic acid-binding Zn ribbon protein